MNTYVIAEAGVNHNGRSELAFELLEVAASAGVDAIKFQTFNANQLVTQNAQMAAYQKENTGKSETQLTMLKNLELDKQDYARLATRAKELNIDFISTAFDSASLHFLLEEVGVTTLKIASGEVTNAPFVLEHARTKKNIIMSTGMCTIGEVETALSVLAYGWLSPSGTPTRQTLLDAYNQVS